MSASWRTKPALQRSCEVQTYLGGFGAALGRFGAAPGDSESGRTAFWLCSCGPSCEVALRLVPSRGACAGIAPDEGAARSVAMREPDGSCAKLGAAATDPAPMTASAAIVLRRFISRLLLVASPVCC